MLYQMVPCWAVTNGAMPCHIKQCHAVPYQTVPCRAISNGAMPCHIKRCYAGPYQTVPCRAISKGAMPCHMIKQCHAGSYQTVPCHAISNSAMPGCILLSCCILHCPAMFWPLCCHVAGLLFYPILLSSRVTNTTCRPYYIHDNTRTRAHPYSLPHHTSGPIPNPRNSL